MDGFSNVFGCNTRRDQLGTLSRRLTDGFTSLAIRRTICMGEGQDKGTSVCMAVRQEKTLRI